MKKFHKEYLLDLIKEGKAESVRQRVSNKRKEKQDEILKANPNN